jgi:hypothetical protein
MPGRKQDAGKRRSHVKVNADTAGSVWKFRLHSNYVYGVIVLPEDRLLEDRIRELCAQAIAAQDPESLRVVLAELRAALREHHLRLKSLVAESIGTSQRMKTTNRSKA